MSANIIFKASINDAHVFKILFELLSHNIKHGSYEIGVFGIRLQMTDEAKKVLFILNLDAEKFQTYRFTHRQQLNIGLNHAHIYDMLRTIKKKDSLELCIYEDIHSYDGVSSELVIKIIPKEKTRVTTSIAKIQTSQVWDIDIPDSYPAHSVDIDSREYSKVMKEMSKICKTITISSKPNYLKMVSESNCVFTREIEFGENDQNLKMSLPEIYNLEQLLKLSKISCLSVFLKIYHVYSQPLCLKTSVGNVGSLIVYVKSKQQIEYDNLN